ncbi:MAG TPA: lipid-A-disaccharide synthase [Deltaproteobacteria bacterium]|jgi:lipid-A-disaccharide synthase|nr:lipid-A-disaccharide synthase [Deltaproteobacteria bacterium]
MSWVVVSAGDASGDLHAAALVSELRARRPELRFAGIGGDALEKAGMDLLVHQRELAIGGFLEVLSSLRRVFRAWRRMGQALRELRPSLLILVDSPDFNIPLARRARRLRIPTLYYVSPQVWAWRRGRIHKIARRVNRMAAIFPFEPSVYAQTGLRVDFVGHPLVEPLAQLAAGENPQRLRAELGLGPTDKLVLLLPGSRRNEIRHHLPRMLKAAALLSARRADVRFALAVAPSLSKEWVAEQVRACVFARGLRLDLVAGRGHEAILACDAALAKPGTVTVEVTLLGRPLVVLGRGNPLSAAIARRIVAVPSWTMPNLVAGRPIVPEFLQEHARPERVAAALEAVLEGTGRELALARLAAVRERFGKGGATARTAAIAEEMLAGPARP